LYLFVGSNPFFAHLVFISDLQFRNAHCFMAYSFTSLSEPREKTNLVTNLSQIFFLSASDTSFHYRTVMSGLSLTKKPRAFQNLSRAFSGARGYPFGLTSEILYVSSGHLCHLVFGHSASFSLNSQWSSRSGSVRLRVPLLLELQSL
jgi:hypothetical protein